MSNPRLTLALDAQEIAVPEAGRIAIYRPRAGFDLSALPKERVHVIQGFRPDHDAFEAAGYDTATAPEGAYSAAIICATRAKAEAHALIADAVSRVDGGPIILDGQKTDGIDSLLKELRKRADVGAAISKAHGKIFALTGAKPADFADWIDPGPRDIGEGFVTQLGVFSADKIDRGSIALAQALPDKLKGRVADLGAGWGYLSRALLENPKITECHLYEAEAAALDCARQNITDPRAHFHWADATKLPKEAPFDTVICNPPFHTARNADPALGRAFIASAAGMLAPNGALWLVANRHLPYETALASLFRDVNEVAGDKAFKVLHAARPQRAKG
ncbi:MAG: 16S rRNA (guanine1207-N2)-methyltransferase [Halocynthiibacter sp.]|jgi:16S rRNA (guanine1207-N2)-methyltransferase